jgi:hypothetical protein
MKANVSESAHGILCEGIRRQKGDLALNLLLTYKDDDQSLLKIMDKLLDRDVYELFKPDSIIMLNPFNPNFKKIQQQQLQLFIDSRQDAPQPQPQPQQSAHLPAVNPSCQFTKPPVPNTLNIPDVNKLAEADTSKQVYHKQQQQQTGNNIDSLSSGWEESENESPNISKSISLLETKYRCLGMSNSNDKASSCSPEPETTRLVSSKSTTTTMNAASCDSKSSTLKKSQPTKRDSGDETDESSSSSTESLPVVTAKPTGQNESVLAHNR